MVIWRSDIQLRGIRDAHTPSANDDANMTYDITSDDTSQVNPFANLIGEENIGVITYLDETFEGIK